MRDKLRALQTAWCAWNGPVRLAWATLILICLGFWFLVGWGLWDLFTG